MFGLDIKLLHSPKPGFQPVIPKGVIHVIAVPAAIAAIGNGVTLTTVSLVLVLIVYVIPAMLNCCPTFERSWSVVKVATPAVVISTVALPDWYTVVEGSINRIESPVSK